MYEDFYSLSAPPFQLTADGRFFFGSQEHSRALAFLQYGIAQREGFVVITGEIGAGKTTLVEHLLATLDTGAYEAARVATTQLDDFDILSMIASSFGILEEGMKKTALITRLRRHFADIQAQKKHALIIIDEAQSLTIPAIEELRMLSNLTIGPKAPFQGIFLGQPEFRAVLAGPHLQQFRQRVVASCHLSSLNEEDTKKYIEHRLSLAGWADDPTFSTAAHKAIFRHSQGVPRRINTLCSRLLLLGYLEECHEIDGQIVENVAAEMAAEIGSPAENGGGKLASPDPVSAQAATDAVDARLARLERAIERHDKAIQRALGLALRYLPDWEG